MKRISIFGATGTLGRAALDVAAHHPQAFIVDTISADKNAQELADLGERHKARSMVLRARDGEAALCEAARNPDIDLVIMAITGMAALRPTLAALKAGRSVAFASKEALVAAGAMMMEEARRYNARLLPLDSEHNAIFQCWQGEPERIVLTASGGPFFKMSAAELANVTPQQACVHPTWTMGPKISVDSATMMNKGLEIIEAAHLFALPSARIDVLIHPQSLLHGMVEYADGSFLCQMGPHDMRTAMTHVMFWPARGVTPGQRLSLQDMTKLEFFPADEGQYRALRLARQALQDGQKASIALNAANEMAVAAFLRGEIRFVDIINHVEQALQALPAGAVTSLEDVVAYDLVCREFSIRQMGGNALT